MLERYVVMTEVSKRSGCVFGSRHVVSDIVLFGLMPELSDVDFDHVWCCNEIDPSRTTRLTSSYYLNLRAMFGNRSLLAHCLTSSPGFMALRCNIWACAGFCVPGREEIL